MKNIFKHILIPSLLVLGVSSFITSISLSSNSSKSNESSSYYNDLGKRFIKNDEVIILLNKSYNKEDLFKELEDKDIPYDFLDSYEGIIHGVKLKVNKSNINLISSLDCVLSIDENNYYLTSPSLLDVKDDLNSIYDEPLDNDSIKDMNVPSSSITNDGEGVLVAILDDSFNIHHEAFKDLDSSTKVKLTRSEVDSIVKSGDFDANLNNQTYYLNNKIPYFHDYGGTIDPTTLNTIKEDDDLMYKGGVHGSHVTSILGANGEFKGVAPFSQLALMKVGGELSSSSSTNVISDEAVLKALNDAYYLGADIISCSFGSDLDESMPTNDKNVVNVINRLKENNVEVNFAAGNNGKEGFNTFESYRYDLPTSVENGSLGGYSLVSGVTSVASTNLTSDNSVYSDISTLDGTKIEGWDQINSTLLNNNSAPKMMWSLVDEDEVRGKFDYVIVPNQGEDKDYEGLDVNNKIALVKRGGIDLVTKIKNAKKQGAIGIIIANQEGLGSLYNFDLQGTSSDELIPTFSISAESYETLVNQEEKSIYIGKTLYSSFSSEGSSQTLEINPQISAPGQNIAGISAENDNGVVTDDEYRYMSGTSMATPNFSGAEALILSSQEFNSSEEEQEFKSTLLNRIMSTADPIKQANDSYVSVRKVGAGEVDVSDAIKTKIYLEDPLTKKSAIELKNNSDISEGHIEFEVDIINKDKLTGNYSVNLSLGIPSITYVDSENSSGFLKGSKVQSSFYTKEVLNKTFDVTLSGEEVQKINVDYTLDKSLLDEILKDFPNGTYIEGYLTFDNIGNNTNLVDLSLPILGFLGDYHKEDVIEPYNFEKEYYNDDKIYSSDMLNQLGYSLGNKYMNFGSFMGVTNKTLETLDISNIILQQEPLDNEFIPVNYSYDEDSGKFIIYAGSIGSADTLYIQNYVNRSVKTNEITLTSLDTNEVVLTDHMFDTMVNEETDYSLIKSKATVSLVNEGYFAHFAYTIIPLKDESSNYFEDGTYSLKFNYTLYDGYTYTKEYILDIDSTSQDVSFKSVYFDSKSLVIVSSKDEISQIRINGINLNKTKLDNGDYQFSFDLDDINNLGRTTSNNKMFIPSIESTYFANSYIEILGKSYGKLNGKVSLDGSAIIFNKTLKETDEVYLEKSRYSSYNGNSNVEACSLSITDRSGMYKKLDVENPYFVTLALEDKYVDSTVDVYNLSDQNSVSSSDNLTPLSSSKDGLSLSLTIDQKDNVTSTIHYDFLLTYSGDIKSDISLPLVVGLSVVGGLIVIGLVITFIVIVKDNKKKDNQ